MNYWGEMNLDAKGTIVRIETKTDTGKKVRNVIVVVVLQEDALIIGQISLAVNVLWLINQKNNVQVLLLMMKKDSKDCGEPFVFSAFGRNDASDAEGYSIMGQYYTKNGQKYIRLNLKKVLKK